VLGKRSGGAIIPGVADKVFFDEDEAKLLQRRRMVNLGPVNGGIGDGLSPAIHALL
jgi:hypothetical protein